MGDRATKARVTMARGVSSNSSETRTQAATANSDALAATTTSVGAWTRSNAAMNAGQSGWWVKTIRPSWVPVR